MYYVLDYVWYVLAHMGTAGYRGDTGVCHEDVYLLEVYRSKDIRDLRHSGRNTDPGLT